ncbi:coiled-coil domain-containing protein 94-like protein [Iris pallida]|uniref:Splicing factor YJU2 n=1 Tax=Iris pallida TaxID=29817 RepID=A0AAX6HR37_IRIPA|nr:coiled-coil domain-containing protein 94-like protein [Iris pallida]
MGERKVLNKYYPPDFDPAKIPRRKQPKNQQMKIRMMLPMSIRCNTCGTYIYKGTKFNSRKEDVVGETYLGIQIFRFYFKCTKCSAELTMKTDPQNSDYVVESGAARNFEPWRAEDEAVDKEKRKRDEEEMGDAMKSLENRAMDSKQDMDILAALEEMRSVKSRHATISVDEMLERLKNSAYEKEKRIMDEMDKADEELIKSIVFPGSKDFVRRIQDDEDEDLDEDILQASTSLSRPSNNALKGKSTSENIVENPTDELVKPIIVNSSRKKESVGGSSLLMPKIIVKPRSVTDQPHSKKPRTGSAENGLPKDGESKNSESVDGKMTDGLPKDGETTNGLLSLCQNYDSDESE